LLSVFYSYVVPPPGDKGKQLFPGNKGYLSNMVAKFSLIMLISSAKIHPTDHISIAEV